MGWLSWSRKSENGYRHGAGVVGLDLNANRVRAALWESGRAPRTLLLDEPHEELPLAVSLEKATPEVGRAALGLARRLPHMACFDFLGELGQAREWRAGRHAFDAAGLLSLTLEHLARVGGHPDYLALVLPAYLSPGKSGLLTALFEKMKFPVRGSAVLPLALVAASETSEARLPSALIVDADDHALSAAVVRCEGNQACLSSTVTLPKLNLRVWKEKLLNALADRCVRTCRRDPRDSAEAEQALYEQIDNAVEQASRGQKVTLSVRSEHWYQDLIQRQDDFDGYCAGLVKQAVGALHELAQNAAPDPPIAVWLTHAAGRLPGLASALHQNMAERTELLVLPAQAGARAAVNLAGRWARAEVPRGHLDTAIPLPEDSNAGKQKEKESASPGNGSIPTFRTSRLEST
jgi:hypothetical protein